MNKPKEAIEQMRKWWLAANECPDRAAILAWADSIPDDAVCVVWPKELTRERLEGLAEFSTGFSWAESSVEAALRALAAIAPVRKKRMVNLWRSRNSHKDIWPSVFDADHDPNGTDATKPWRKVNREPVEIEE